jgi:hypothetical protein
MERMNRRNGDYGCASDPWASFSEPKTQSYKQEDVRFWEVSGHNITPNTDHIIDALLIRRNPGQEPSLSQDVIKGFLEQASLAELNDTNKTHPDERPVALLDDRKHDDQGPATGHARTSKGALTARQLYRELEKGVRLVFGNPACLQRPPRTELTVHLAITAVQRASGSRDR